MKQLFLVLVATLWTGLEAIAQVDTGQPVGSTPYDQYMGPVRQTYGQISGGTPSIGDVRASLRTANRFRYYFDPSQPYTPQMPEVTESRQQGDCKAKSLWLAKKLGDPNSRYAVGMQSANSKLAHAWLLWPQGSTWMILDPTNTTEVIQADRVVGRKLIPRFSYRGGRAYVHPSYSQYIR